MPAFESVQNLGFMDSVYDWGLHVIRLFQSVANPFLTTAVKTLTLFGEPLFYIIALPVLFWCTDNKKAFRLIFLSLISFGLNTIIKESLHISRPYIRDPSVEIVRVSGFSTPSGHAQASATFWGILVTVFPAKKAGKIALKLFMGVAIPLVISLTRIYLGVHYPTDVIFGWVLGAAFTAISFWLWTPAAKIFSCLPRVFKMLLLAFLVLAMNTLCMQDTSIPAAILGFGAGYILLEKKGGFDSARGTSGQKFVRLLLGFCGVALLFLGLKFIFPQKASLHYELFRFIRYGSVCFWASYVAPLFFIKCKIAQPEFVPSADENLEEQKKKSGEDKEI